MELENAKKLKLKEQLGFVVIIYIISSILIGEGPGPLPSSLATPMGI